MFCVVSSMIGNCKVSWIYCQGSPLPLPFGPFFKNFKILTVLYDMVFHQVHPMNMYFHKRQHAFVV